MQPAITQETEIMRRLLLLTVAVAGLSGLVATQASAAPVQAFQTAPMQASIVHVDYYHNHHHWHHRRWDHGHWRYWD
jgi:hypothetical protein